MLRVFIKTHPLQVRPEGFFIKKTPAACKKDYPVLGNVVP